MRLQKFLRLFQYPVFLFAVAFGGFSIFLRGKGHKSKVRHHRFGIFGHPVAVFRGVAQQAVGRLLFGVYLTHRHRELFTAHRFHDERGALLYISVILDKPKITGLTINCQVFVHWELPP
ncbi:hypothetical protein SDC9_134926 [bioreactor metagenome]|uniref:Uncharacterized protein n=1 Tax=bioreactor metagenome TaxID=1076179 RepID=A0A645DEP3_9ZZZZ